MKVYKLNQMKQYKFLINILLLSSALVATSCKDDNPSIDDYPWNYEIKEVPAEFDIPVGALLYNASDAFRDDSRWGRITEPYDAATGAIGPYLMPAQGQYSMMGTDAAGAEDRATALGKIVEWSKKGRIDFLVTPSVREDANNLFPRNLSREDSTFIDLLSGRNDTLNWHNDGSMKYAISVELENLAGNLNCNNNNSLLEKAASKTYTLPGGETVTLTAEERAYSFMKRVARYFNDPTYQHVNGKPVLVFLGADKFYCENVKKIYDGMRAAIKEECGKDVYIIARQKSWEPTARFKYFFMDGGVDALTMRNMCNVGSAYWERTYWLNVLINENFKENRKYMDREYPNMDFLPSVSPGYSQYIWDGNLNYPLIQPNTEEFRKRCWVAKMNLTKTPMVIIDAFNQWGFGNAIEPADPEHGNGYGESYLDIIRKEFKR